MVEQYSRFFEKIAPVIQDTLNKIDRIELSLKYILNDIGISLEDTDTIRSFLEELRKYFRKLGITIYESKSKSGERLIILEKGLEEEEEEYEEFLGVYNSLGKVLNNYLSDNSGGFTIDSEDLIAYVNRLMPLSIEISGIHFLEGLEWYLDSRAGIDMGLRPLISMDTGSIKGLTLVFEKA